jgi:AcrR family transcriptional regulator
MPDALTSAPPPQLLQPEAGEALDPRIRRTRELLQQALGALLETKDFDKISVQDITDAATLNRATFYAHYPDKFALLECMVGTRLQALLDQRGVKFDGTCTGALRGIALGVCDFMAQSQGTPCAGRQRLDRHMEPHMESAVAAVVRRMLLYGLRQHSAAATVSPEIQASAVSWAICGAASEWMRSAQRAPSEAMAEEIVRLVAPMLHVATER